MLLAAAKVARPAYKSQRGYWGRSVSIGSVSQPKPLPKWAPKQDPLERYRPVSSPQTIIE